MVVRTVINEVETERIRQIAKGFTDEADDLEPIKHFCWFIEKYAGWAAAMSQMGPPQGYETARRRLVQVAALAVAAVESLDRRYPEGKPICKS